MDDQKMQIISGFIQSIQEVGSVANKSQFQVFRVKYYLQEDAVSLAHMCNLEINVLMMEVLLKFSRRLCLYFPLDESKYYYLHSPPQRSSKEYVDRTYELLSELYDHLSKEEIAGELVRKA